MKYLEHTKHYQLVEKAIQILENANHSQIHHERNSEIRLSELAKILNMAPEHLQRTFKAWAGVSPKQFFQSLQKDHARALLAQGQSSLSATISTGLKSTSQLHSLMLKFEALTPGELRSGGSGLAFTHGYTASPLGKTFICLTPKGLNSLEFETEELDYLSWLSNLQKLYPNASFQENNKAIESIIQSIFELKSTIQNQLTLQLSGSAFQLHVWQALLHLPAAHLASYQQIAAFIGKPKSSRAVGSAIAKNPIGFLIPCHRVIQSTGELGQYRWHSARKKALHIWEQGQFNTLE